MNRMLLQTKTAAEKIAHKKLRNPKLRAAASGFGRGAAGVAQVIGGKFIAAQQLA